MMAVIFSCKNNREEMTRQAVLSNSLHKTVPISTYIGTAKNTKTDEIQNMLPFYIRLPTHSEYKKCVEQGKHIDSPFFHDKIYAPRPIDVCYYTTKTTQSPW